MGLFEAAYEDNLGFVEMMKFYKQASDADIKKMEKLLDKGAWDKAWSLLKRVTGVALRNRKWRAA